jgi:lipopolysaccharide/colanic/teichoic acid biosynthesis glycosyltransferase
MFKELKMMDENINPEPNLSSQCYNTKVKNKNKYLIIKRIFDISISIFGLIILAIILPFVYIAVKLDTDGPVFFVQKRVGRNGKIFKIYKFRSMHCKQFSKKKLKAKKSENGFSQVHNDPRITKVGVFLRKFSIDEIPQFINVLKGDMSLIGPRPFIKSEIDLLSKKHLRRLDVKPGITGMAQINGRSTASINEREEWDLYYVDNLSFLLDLKILLKTFIVVIKKQDAM